jgi:FKBP-type peptidyl-prolyl cis-trans isomerase
VPRLTIVPLLLLALLIAGCGGSDSTAEQPKPAATAPAATPSADAGSAAVDAIAAKLSKDLSRRPRVPKPAGDAPTALVTKDIVVGSGKSAVAGDQVSVQYVGVLWDGAKPFDASWDRGGQPFAFQLGGGQVIPGWDEGVAGMKPGGRRLLVIPPDKGYGAQGSPPAIPANAPLIFVVDLQRIG